MPKVYGWEHFTYLAVCAVIAAAAIFFVRKYAKTEKTLSIVTRAVGGALFACILWNRISLCIKNSNALTLIPDTFCGISSLILSLAMLIGKRNNIVFHFICYLGFVGGTLTLAYPDFIGQAASVFYPPTISGLLHHTVMVFAIILMLLTKYFVPTLKRWYVLPLGLCCVMTFGIFEITALGFNDAMQIFTPLLPDTIFTWWFCGALLLPFSYIVMLLFDYFLVWRKKKIRNEAAEQ